MILLEISWIVLIGLCCQAICRADRKHRKQVLAQQRQHQKEMRKIARQERTKYVPVDTTNVVYLSQYRKKKQTPVA